MDFFNKCFDKHSFLEMNKCDYDVFIRAIDFFSRTHKLTDELVFFDIGCNCGSFIKLLQSKGIKSNIHCFEPHPILSKKVKEFYPFVNMNEYCISNTDGTVDIIFPQYSIGLSSIINRPVFSELNQNLVSLNVKSEKLDTYCDNNKIDKIDFIKIDVEGAEKLVFEGAKDLLSKQKIKAGIFEIGQTLKDAGTNETEICNMLRNYGYDIITNISKSDFYFYIK